jgi:hypothetical protein
MGDPNDSPVVMPVTATGIRAAEKQKEYLWRPPCYKYVTPTEFIAASPPVQRLSG